MEKLAKQLNSAEDLDATEGEFHVEMTFIKSSGCGGKNGGKKGNPGWMSYEKLLKKRGCIIQIKNRDELCCARAIVTLKARVDKDPEYQNIMQGRGVQGWKITSQRRCCGRSVRTGRVKEISRVPWSRVSSDCI